MITLRWRRKRMISRHHSVQPAVATRPSRVVLVARAGHEAMAGQMDENVL